MKNVFGGAEKLDLDMHLGGRASGPKVIATCLFFFDVDLCEYPSMMPLPRWRSFFLNLKHLDAVWFFFCLCFGKDHP